MILEPKHKNFTGPLQMKETVKRFNIRRHMSIPRAFECYYFKIILHWWHSPLKYELISWYKNMDTARTYVPGMTLFQNKDVGEL
jgi:hypothetical protein